MQDEAQLQGLLSWAIPRYLEYISKKSSWSAATPPNQAQSTKRFQSSAYDMLALINSDAAFILEHKILYVNNEETEYKFSFKKGQLPFLAACDSDDAIPAYVSFEDPKYVDSSLSYKPSSKTATTKLASILTIRAQPLNALLQTGIEAGRIKDDESDDSVLKLDAVQYKSMATKTIKDILNSAVSPTSNLRSGQKAVYEILLANLNEGSYPNNFLLYLVSEKSVTQYAGPQIKTLCTTLAELQKKLNAIGKDALKNIAAALVKENLKKKKRLEIFSQFCDALRLFSGGTEQEKISAAQDFVTLDSMIKNLSPSKLEIASIDVLASEKKPITLQHHDFFKKEITPKLTNSKSNIKDDDEKEDKHEAG